MSVSSLRPTQIRALLVLLVLLPFIPTVVMLRLMLGAVENEREISRERIVDLYQRSLATVGSYLPSHLNAFAIDWADAPPEQFQQLTLEQSVDGALIYDARRQLAFPPPPGAGAGSGFGIAGGPALIPREKKAVGLSQAVATVYPDTFLVSSLVAWKPVYGVPGGLYAIRARNRGSNIILLRSGRTLASLVQAFYSQTFDPLVSIRIQNDAGQFFPRIVEVKDEPIVQASLGECLPGWQVQLFLRKPKAAVESGAQDQLKAFIWIASAAIIADLFIAGMAAFAVSQQWKMNELRNTSLATVSHELKTPIAAARMLIDTILEGRCQHPGQALEYIQLISGENHRLGRLVENFLTASRIESNAYVFKPVGTEPSAILDSALEAIRPRLKEANCRLDLNVASDLRQINVERDAMVVVLVNLLENALKYSGDSKQIGLSAHSQGNSVLFEVSDNGVGIARQQRKKIFQRFYRIDEKLSRRQEGAGLGLSIVKYIVEAHGGSVGVRSNHDQGSIFTVSLPSVAANGS